MIFHAVRGELTREQVIKLGLLEPDADVTLGDAGILAPFLLDNMPPKRYFCGIVPHVADYGLPCVVRTQDKIRNSVVINVREDPLKVLEQMASCEMILASAMHGLIVADALGIPNQWVRFSDNPQIGGFGDRFKYHDYYSIFPGYPHEPIKPDAVMNSFIPERFITQFNPRTEIVRMTQQSLLECAGKMKEVLG